MFTLHYAPHTCSLATHVALEEAGAAYDLVRVSFAAEEQKSAAFRAINAKARVPALVTPRGVLTETPAMLAFVAQSFPAAGLLPLDDAFAFARAQEFNAYLCATLHVAHAHRMRGTRWTDDPAAIEALRRFVPQSVAACFEMIEAHMLAGPYVLGDAYSLCDTYLFTIAQWMESDGVDPARFPKVAAHRARIGARAAVRKCIAEELA